MPNPAPNPTPRLAIIQTGGTIASRPDEQGNIRPLSSPNDLTQALPQLARFDLEVYQPFNLPSPHITPAHMQELAQFIHHIAPNVDGIVITHGTDTLEETAFFLYLTLQVDIPVVLTGSMKHALEPSWDGPGNVWQAALTAMHPRSRDRRVLVVFGGDIFDARTVTKTHTTLPHAFGGYPGPIGQVGVGMDGTGVHYFAQPETRHPLAAQSASSRVDILYAYAGWQGEGLQAALSSADGLVIAALGTGNLPPKAAQLLEGAKIPVVLATRTHAGPILPVYGYEGGGKKLLELGCIPASFLNAHKARILLIVLLGMGLTREKMLEVFSSLV
jgi:L-asparaginase